MRVKLFACSPELLDSEPTAGARTEPSSQPDHNQEHGDDADDTDHGSDIATDAREDRGPATGVLTGEDALSDDDGEHGD